MIRTCLPWPALARPRVAEIRKILDRWDGFPNNLEIPLTGSCAVPPNAVQPDTTRRIESGGNRFINAVWRDGNLWAATAVGNNFGSGTVAAIRLFSDAQNIGQVVRSLQSLDYSR